MPYPSAGRTRRQTTLSVVGLAALVALLALSLPAGAFAKGKPAPAPSGSATVVANPSPATVGVSFTVSGSGYQPTTQLAVKFITATATSFRYAASDASGGFQISHTTWSAGTYTIEVWQSGSKGSTLKARTSLTVW